MAALDMMLSDAFSSTEILPHLLCASCDTHHSVVETASNALRRISRPDLEDPKLVRSLLDLVSSPSG